MKNNKLIKCADGFTMSVQASHTAYCAPRNDNGPYTAAEVGYPNIEESLLLQYAENPELPTKTVYSFVPKSTILSVIVKHGGIISGQLPAGFPYLYASGVLEAN
jgi:hypothetical protein